MHGARGRCNREAFDRQAGERGQISPTRESERVEDFVAESFLNDGTATEGPRAKGEAAAPLQTR